MVSQFLRGLGRSLSRHLAPSENHVRHPPPGSLFGGRAWGTAPTHTSRQPARAGVTSWCRLTLGPSPTDLMWRGTHQRCFFQIRWFACGTSTRKDVPSTSSFRQTVECPGQAMRPFGPIDWLRQRSARLGLLQLLPEPPDPACVTAETHPDLSASTAVPSLWASPRRVTSVSRRARNSTQRPVEAAALTRSARRRPRALRVRRGLGACAVLLPSFSHKARAPATEGAPTALSAGCVGGLPHAFLAGPSGIPYRSRIVRKIDTPNGSRSRSPPVHLPFRRLIPNGSDSRAKQVRVQGTRHEALVSCARVFGLVRTSLGLDMLTEPKVRTDRVNRKSFRDQVQFIMHDRPRWVPGFQRPGHLPGCFSDISGRTSWHAVHLCLTSTTYTLLHVLSGTQNTRTRTPTRRRSASRSG